VSSEIGNVPYYLIAVSFLAIEASSPTLLFCQAYVTDKLIYVLADIRGEVIIALPFVTTTLKKIILLF
jgi:hypothetical protein